MRVVPKKRYARNFDENPNNLVSRNYEIRMALYRLTHSTTYCIICGVYALIITITIMCYANSGNDSDNDNDQHCLDIYRSLTKQMG